MHRRRNEEINHALACHHDRDRAMIISGNAPDPQFLLVPCHQVRLSRARLSDDI